METKSKLTGALKRIGLTEIVLIVIAAAISWVAGWTASGGFVAVLAFVNFFVLASLITGQMEYQEPQRRYSTRVEC
jgi:hypothetical protein